MRFSLAQQIEEIEREIAMRLEVYPRQVTRGTMRQSVADMHIDRMRAVLITLQWFQKHEAKLRAKVGETS